MDRSAGRVLIGTSGWQYDSWVGPFYEGRDRLLHRYAQRFPTVEVNSTFYGLPDGRTTRGWMADTSDREFTFAVKASRYITHMKKLKDPEDPLRRFFEAVEPLKDRAEVVLFQLPPSWKHNAERLRSFFGSLPQAKRYAFEFRDPSWLCDETYEILREHNAAFCIYHLDDFLSPKEITADYVYIRLHGARGKYRGSYSSQDLSGWAGAISAWSRSGRDVYVYFDNDQEAVAPGDAARLQQMLGGDRA